MLAGVAVGDKSKWGSCRRPNSERAIARRMPGTRTENLATDYLAAKRSCKFAEVERLIVAYDLSAHLKTHCHAPGGGPALKLDHVWGTPFRAITRACQ
jgi:hypothetical protein